MPGNILIFCTYLLTFRFNRTPVRIYPGASNPLHRSRHGILLEQSDMPTDECCSPPPTAMEV